MQRTSSRLVIARAIAALTILLVAGRLADAQPPPASASSADAALAAQKAAFLRLARVNPQSGAGRAGLARILQWRGRRRLRQGNAQRDSRLPGERQGASRRRAVGARAPGVARQRPEGARRGRVSDRQRRQDAARGSARRPNSERAAPERGSSSPRAPDADSSALYARLTAVTPARKIAYKAIKPDAFFVVSGQDGASNFYTRFDKNAAASPPIRGFTFAYPSSQAAQLDRVAIAVANSFEPFPQLATTPADSAATGAAVAPAIGLGSARAQSLAGGDGARRRAGQGADGAQGGRLPEPDGRRQAGTGRADGRGDQSGDDRRRFRPPRANRRASARRGRMSSCSVSPDRASPRARLRSPAARRGLPSSPQWRRARGGGPVFDRRGALVGLVAPIEGEPKRVAGVALAAPARRHRPRRHPRLPWREANPRPPARPTSAPATSPRARRRRCLRSIAGASRRRVRRRVPAPDRLQSRVAPAVPESGTWAMMLDRLRRAGLRGAPPAEETNAGLVRNLAEVGRVAGCERPPYPSMSHFSALAPASSRTRFSSAPNVRASPS